MARGLGNVHGRQPRPVIRRSLITEPCKGQSQEVFDKLTGKKAIVAFTEAEGADSHCEPAASGIRGERIFDWLNEQIPA